MNNDLISRSELLETMPKNDILLSMVVRQIIADAPDAKIDGNTSDGYHTFNELYHHRAVLFSVIVKAFHERAWKSKKHHDGTMYDGMFIVGIDTPQGQATYHYDVDPYWGMFACRELDCAPEWDGHTPAEAISRLGTLEPVQRGKWIYDPNSNDWGIGGYICSKCEAKNNNLPCSRVTKLMLYVGSNYCPHCGAKMEDDE